MTGPRPPQQGTQSTGESGMKMGTLGMCGEEPGKRGSLGGKGEAELRSPYGASNGHTMGSVSHEA